jgi:DNA-binding NtrC family response regulator
MIYTDLKLGEVTDKEEGLGSERSNILQIWDDRKIRELTEDSRDISLKTICRQYVAELERRSIVKALKLTRWNRKRAAQLLQVSYKTLLNRIEEFKLVK